jgi:long-chain fatty acid transport protein
MKRSVLISIAAATTLFASAYRLPENSVNSTALSGAYVANAHGADSSYYNPANMVFNEDKNSFEGDLTYINLSKIDYKDSRASFMSGETKSEDILAPSLFFSSRDYNNFRYGLSLAVPGGLSKRWDSAYEKLFAKEFTLKILEFNPSIAYKVNENFAIGGGVRVVYSEGVVQSDGTDITKINASLPQNLQNPKLNKPAIRDMEADTTEFGYNLAFSYKPDNRLTFSTTYRSNVDLNHEGNAKLYLSGTKLYDGGASVEVPLPAVLALAVSYDFGSSVVEFEWDKTYWSEYKSLDFEFKDKVPAALGAFDRAVEKNWSDTNAFRLGVTHNYNDRLTLMGSFAFDESPIDKKHIGFELPDSDALIFSGGFRYRYSDDMEFGLSLLYDVKDDQSVKNDYIDGEFSNAKALLVTGGFSYKF